jgi:ribonuclease HI
MTTKRALERQRLTRVLELLGKRLPAELLQPEFPELTREDVHHIFHVLAEHVRGCQQWKEFAQNVGKRSDPRVMRMSLHCDGASRGNPGPAGAGVVLSAQNGRQLLEVSRFLDTATNNEAEYQALIRGLKAAEDLGIKSLQIFSDSELVVKQVRGEYKVRNLRLQLLFRQVMTRLQQFDDYAIVHVGRELNEKADRLAKDAIDRGLQGGERETYRLTERE